LFEFCLRRTIQEVRPAFIGEEDDEVANRGEISIAREIGAELRIEHRFCDANKQERFAIGSKNFMTIALAARPALSLVLILISRSDSQRRDALKPM
jgi:hypothetical protein